MKKSELAKAIRNVLAENTKNKLDESKIRQAIREVLAEEDPSGRTKLPAVSFLSRYHPEVFSTIADANIGVTNYDIADIIDDYVEYLKLFGADGKVINEEGYDTVRDIHTALGRNASQDEIEQYLGRSLSGSELKAFGFNSGTITGYKYGVPQYAGQGQKKTYGRRY